MALQKEKNEYIKEVWEKVDSTDFKKGEFRGVLTAVAKKKKVKRQSVNDAIRHWRKFSVALAVYKEIRRIEKLAEEAVCN